MAVVDRKAVLSNIVNIKLVKVEMRVVLIDIQTANPQHLEESLTDMSKLLWSSLYL